MRRAVLALPLVALTSVAAAQPPGPNREVHCIRVTSAISVDGALSEPAWGSAEACSAFVQRDPIEGARPSQRTEVRVLFDKDALYVGARMFDTSPDSIVTELSRRDVGTRSDRFTIYLDPYYDRRSGYYFGVNAAGTKFDGTL